MSRLEDLILHGSVTTVSGRRRCVVVGIAGAVVVSTIEVVGHLRVQLLCSLLRRSAALSLLGKPFTSLANNNSALGTVRAMLDSCGRLGLSFGWRNALSKGLRLGNEVCRGNDNLNLDRAVVDQKTVQGGESLAGAVGVVEGNMGNTPANATWAVGKLDLLDLTDGLLEVFLSRGIRG
jgi:hypothetical protein